MRISDWSSDVCSSDLEPERLVEYAEAIHASGGHLLSLINDILDLSKIEAGRMEIHPEWIDPAATAGTVAGLMQEQAAAKGLVIDCRIDQVSARCGPIRGGSAQCRWNCARTPGSSHGSPAASTPRGGG